LRKLGKEESKPLRSHLIWRRKKIVTHRANRREGSTKRGLIFGKGDLGRKMSLFISEKKHRKKKGGRRESLRRPLSRKRKKRWTSSWKKPKKGGGVDLKNAKSFLKERGDFGLQRGKKNSGERICYLPIRGAGSGGEGGQTTARGVSLPSGTSAREKLPNNERKGGKEKKVSLPPKKKMIFP